MSLVHSLEKFIDAYIIKDSKALLQEQTLPLQFIQIQVLMPNGSPLNIQVPLSTTSEKMQASSDHIRTVDFEF